MAVVVEARVTGSTDKFERAFIESVIAPINNERENFNFRNRNDETVTPKAILPTETAMELKESYEIILSEKVVETDAQLRAQYLASDPGTTKISDLRDEWAVLTETERQTIKAQIEALAADDPA